MDANNHGKRVFIDESYGKDFNRGHFSVLVGSLMHLPSIEARESIREFHRGEKAFKTSRTAGNRRYAKIAKGLEWTQRCTSVNFAIISFHPRKSSERMRQESLTVLLREIAKNSVTSITFDSRRNPDAQDPGFVDKSDLLSVRRLRQIGLLGRNVEVSHRTDEEEELLVIPDLIAWTTKNHIEGKFPELWKLIELTTQKIFI